MQVYEHVHNLFDRSSTVKNHFETTLDLSPHTAANTCTIGNKITRLEVLLN